MTCDLNCWLLEILCNDLKTGIYRSYDQTIPRPLEFLHIRLSDSSKELVTVIQMTSDTLALTKDILTDVETFCLILCDD